MIQKYAPTAAGNLTRVSKTFEITQKVLGGMHDIGLLPATAIAGPQSSAAEVLQANAVARMTGNDVLLVDNSSNRGFDALQIVGGIVNPQGAIPTKLKGLASSNPQAVLQETADSLRAISGVTLPSGGPLTGVQVFISAPNMNANALANFANNGPLPRGKLVSSGTSRYAEATSFAPHGAVKVLNLGGTLTGAAVMAETWNFNERLQPTSTILKQVADNDPTHRLLSLDYYYCANQGTSCSSNNGNMMAQVIAYSALGGETAAFSVTQAFTYDKVNRLKTFTEGAKSETNDYDALGNRWVSASSGFSFSDPLTPVAASWFNNKNQIKGSGSAILYDNVGNQTSIGPYLASYDAENRMAAVNSTSNGSADYSYDGIGKRVKKTAGSVVTLFVYDAMGQLVMERTGAVGTNGLEFMTSDHLGSVRLVTSASGTVIRRHDYRPFGGDLTDERTGKYADTRNALRLTSKERDAETGLDYIGARYLSSAQGRMTSPDPYMIVIAAANREQLDSYLGNPQNWNRYAYAFNNPLRFIDPTDLDPISLSDCQKDSECTVVKLNVIFDKDADIYDKNGNLLQEYQPTLDTRSFTPHPSVPISMRHFPQ